MKKEKKEEEKNPHSTCFLLFPANQHLSEAMMKIRRHDLNLNSNGKVAPLKLAKTAINCK